jgi:hypothetical protein
MSYVVEILTVVAVRFFFIRTPLRFPRVELDQLDDGRPGCQLGTSQYFQIRSKIYKVISQHIGDIRLSSR